MKKLITLLLILTLLLSLVSCSTNDPIREDVYIDGTIYMWNGDAWVPLTSDSGDVVGPAGATDDATPRYDGVTGKLIQDSQVTIDDAGNITTAGNVDGRDVSADGTKLDGIETGAEVSTKEIFVTVHHVSGGDTTLGPLGVYINAADEQGQAVILVPQDFTSVVALEIVVSPAATGANMHVEVSTFYGMYSGGESHSVHTETGDAIDIGATVAGENLVYDISSLVDANPLTAGDLLRVRVRFDGTATATHLYFRGIRLKYN